MSKTLAPAVVCHFLRLFCETNPASGTDHEFELRLARYASARTPYDTALTPAVFNAILRMLRDSPTHFVAAPPRAVDEARERHPEFVRRVTYAPNSDRAICISDKAPVRTATLRTHLDELPERVERCRHSCSAGVTLHVKTCAVLRLVHAVERNVLSADIAPPKKRKRAVAAQRVARMRFSFSFEAEWRLDLTVNTATHTSTCEMEYIGARDADPCAAVQRLFTGVITPILRLPAVKRWLQESQ